VLNTDARIVVKLCQCEQPLYSTPQSTDFEPLLQSFTHSFLSHDYWWL